MVRINDVLFTVGEVVSFQSKLIMSREWYAKLLKSERPPSGVEMPDSHTESGQDSSNVLLLRVLVMCLTNYIATGYVINLPKLSSLKQSNSYMSICRCASNRS